MRALATWTSLGNSNIDLSVSHPSLDQRILVLRFSTTLLGMDCCLQCVGEFCGR
jgi:hypothetical protein